MNCKDCLYWDAPYSQKHWNRCVAIMDFSGTSPDSFAFTVDDEVDTAARIELETGPTFGCVRFQQKETKE